MALILSIIYASGGQGKTTTVEFLAEIYSAIGHKVLTVDLEPQHSLTNYYQADTKDSPTLTEAILGQVPMADAIQETEKGHIIPSTRSLDIVEKMYNATESDQPEYQELLSERLGEIEQDFDIILIDTPTQLGYLSKSAARASDGVVIPIDRAKFEVETFMETVVELQKVFSRDNKRGSRIYGVCPTKVVKGRVVTAEALEKMENALKQYDLTLLPSINICESIVKAQNHKVTLFKQDAKAEAIGNFVALAGAILEEYGKDVE